MCIRDRGVRALYTPNANYWGEVPQVTVDFAFVTDSAVAFEAYKNNEFDICLLYTSRCV